jgi:hypothetical protein
VRRGQPATSSVPAPTEPLAYFFPAGPFRLPPYRRDDHVRAGEPSFLVCRPSRTLDCGRDRNQPAPRSEISEPRHQPRAHHVSVQPQVRVALTTRGGRIALAYPVGVPSHRTRYFGLLRRPGGRDAFVPGWLALGSIRPRVLVDRRRPNKTPWPAAFWTASGAVVSFTASSLFTRSCRARPPFEQCTMRRRFGTEPKR